MTPSDRFYIRSVTRLAESAIITSIHTNTTTQTCPGQNSLSSNVVTDYTFVNAHIMYRLFWQFSLRIVLQQKNYRKRL